MLFAVIMAGGQGTRLWPLSRKKLPKQLQRFLGDKTLIQETFDRINKIIDPSQIYISTTPEYYKQIQKQLPAISKKNYILEPAAMGNAAACGLATAFIAKDHPEANLIFIPADHAIKENTIFKKCLNFAERAIKKYPDFIVTLGVNPSRPDTGLGYIKLGKKINDFCASNLDLFQVDRFVEKPNLKKAKQFVDSGNYLWNMGVFVWRANNFLKLYQQHMPANFSIINKIMAQKDRAQYETILSREYKKAEVTSIDFGLIEKIKKILVIPCNFQWSDIGSWGSLFELLSELEGQALISKGHHISLEDTNSLVFAQDKLVATIGLEDVVVIDSEDAILICNRHKAHQVKDLLNKIKEAKKDEYL